MKTIPLKILLQAGFNWDNYRDKKDDFPTFNNGLDDFLGCNTYGSCQWAGTSDNEVLVPDNTRDKFYMLASPHFRTLLKMYEIKNGPIVYKSEQHTEQSS